MAPVIVITPFDNYTNELIMIHKLLQKFEETNEVIWLDQIG